MSKRQVVVILWFDSSVAPALSVFTPQEAANEKLITLKTAGWLLHETDSPHGGHYVLATSLHGEEDWRGVQLIPKVNVISIKKAPV